MLFVLKNKQQMHVFILNIFPFLAVTEFYIQACIYIRYSYIFMLHVTVSCKSSYGGNKDKEEDIVTLS